VDESIWFATQRGAISAELEFLSANGLGHLERTFPAPNSHNSNDTWIDTINDTKWWMHNFSQIRDAKLRDYPAALWKVREPFHG
jgi:hypothetical protein